MLINRMIVQLVQRLFRYTANYVSLGEMENSILWVVGHQVQNLTQMQAEHLWLVFGQKGST